MEKKMAKFAAVQNFNYQDTNQDVFKKITSSNLKKKLKCKKVIELKGFGYKNKNASEVAEISEYKLSEMRNLLISTDLEDMTESRFNAEKNTKIFIFSDDVKCSEIKFEGLEDKCVIKIFDLTTEDINNFTQSIKTIQTADDTISSLEEARELCESLKYLQSDLNLTLLYRRADEEIDEKLSDIEHDLESSKEFLEEIFATKWK
jgi:hypothetical protein